MEQVQKDALFALGFQDGRDGKALLEDESSECAAVKEYCKGYRAGAAARRRASLALVHSPAGPST